MAWTTSDKVMEYREKSRVIDLVVEMLDGWRRHQSSKDAWLLAFFSFLSLFPLLLAAVTILGIVLEGNDDLRERIVSGAMSEIPVLGPELNSPEAISGGVLSILLGLGGALWSSGKAFVGLQDGLDDVWEVPLDDRSGLPAKRGKALLGLVIIGASQIGSIAIASVISAAGLPTIGRIALVIATVAINILVIAAMYRFLTSASLEWDDIWIGAVIAGIVFTVLQNFGTTLVVNFAGVEDPDADGGVRQLISVIIGVITWMSFVGITVMMCAELNAARKRLGDGNHVPDDFENRLVLRN